VAVTDCLNFGSPEKPDGYYQLAECIEGMSEACEIFGTPVVSGNVSLFNETDRGAVYPTPTVGMVGVLEDVDWHATPAFKREGDMVVVVGAFSGFSRSRWESSLAGSSYLEIIHDRVAGRPPVPDLPAEKRAADLVRGMISSGLVDTVHDLSGGGEAVALAEMALAGGTGFEYEGLEFESLRGDGILLETLFGEQGAGFLVSVPEARWTALEDTLGRYEEGKPDIAYDVVGRTGGSRFKVGDLIDVSLSDLRGAYERDLFEQHAPEGGHIG
jgi:phosphoribosylformylglycinamidine synthase